MRVLIIGGTRFIGPRVVVSLARQGHDVTVLHRGQTITDLPAGVTTIKVDRSEIPALTADFNRSSPDVVLDMICMTEQDARETATAFRGIARRLVVLSSMDVYRAYGCLKRLESHEPDSARLDEDSPLRSALYPYRAESKSADDMLYNYEKILVERRLIEEIDLPVTVLRLPAVYGPGDHRCFEYLKRMLDGQKRILLGRMQARWRWTRGYVDNVADAIVLSVNDERAAGRTYNVGEVDALTEADWARAIGEAAGWDGEIVTVPDEALPEHLRMPFDFRHHLSADTRRIRTELGYDEQVPRGEAITRTVEWERRNPLPQFDPSRFNYEAEDAV